MLLGKLWCRLFGHKYHPDGLLLGFTESCERCPHWRIALKWQRFALEQSDAD